MYVAMLVVATLRAPTGVPEDGPMRRRMLMAMVAAAFLSAGVASTASASFIYTRGNAQENDYVYAGLVGLGEVNNVTVSQFTSGGALYYNFVETSGAQISTFDPRCQRATPSVVFCPVVSDGTTWNADAELHDGDDTATMNTTRPARIEGGLGSDVLKGGSAGDTILGNNSDPGTDGNDV